MYLVEGEESEVPRGVGVLEYITARDDSIFHKSRIISHVISASSIYSIFIYLGSLSDHYGTQVQGTLSSSFILRS